MLKDIFGRHNHYVAYYKAAELLHKEIELKASELWLPRNYMYALALELALKDLLFSKKIFCKEHEHHRIEKLFKIALEKKLLDSEKPCVKNLNKNNLLNKLSNIILWTARYCYPKCPKNEEEYIEHVQTHDKNEFNKLNESGLDKYLCGEESPALSDEDILIIREFIKSYYEVRESFSIALSKEVQKKWPSTISREK